MKIYQGKTIKNCYVPTVTYEVYIDTLLLKMHGF